MIEMPSAEFRKQYAKLRKPTAVTANGHVIGQWIPEGSATYVMARKIEDGEERHTAHGLTPPRGARTEATEAQARRDELLGRINRSR